MTLKQLSPRQREVYDLYRAGWSYRQIADRLFIEPKTVKGHLYLARKVLGITPRRGIRRTAIPSSLTGLRPSEQRVVNLARDGLTDRQIGVRLGISYHTVRNALASARRRYAEHQEQEAA